MFYTVYYCIPSSDFSILRKKGGWGGVWDCGKKGLRGNIFFSKQGKGLRISRDFFIKLGWDKIGISRFGYSFFFNLVTLLLCGFSH